MTEQSKRTAAIGDPDQPLAVATMIAALTRLRITGASGPIVHRLHPEQANDIEAALIAGPGNGMTFRGAPVKCSADFAGEVLCTETGLTIAILSSRRLNGRDRVPDPRAASMAPDEIAALKADAESNRRAYMSADDRLAEVRRFLCDIRTDILVADVIDSLRAIIGPAR